MKIADIQPLDNPFHQIGSPSVLTGANSNLGSIFTVVLPFVFYGAGIALLIYMVLGGFQLMLSKGDPKAIQAAQAKITNAIIGFLIVIGSAVIVRLLGQLFGLTIFGSIIK